MTSPYKPDYFLKFYNDQGVFAFKRMFWELNTDREATPPAWTLKDSSHMGYPSAYEVYMDSIDEYDAAIKIAGSLKRWDTLVKAKWFVNGLPQHGFAGLKVWREHMARRDASLAKEVIIKNTKSGQTSAAKELKSMSKEIKPVGRKQKETSADTTLALIKDFKSRVNE